MALYAMEVVDAVAKLGLRWALTDDDTIRTEVDPLDCPLTALARARLGHGYTTACWSTAAIDLGVAANSAEAIVHAADEPCYGHQSRRWLRRYMEHELLGEEAP